VTDDVDAAVARADFLYTDVWVSMGEPEAEWGERIPLLLPNRVDAEMLQATGSCSFCTACRVFMTGTPNSDRKPSSVFSWTVSR
jgi:ornithine carbamoyltransferase